jgi:hypothetical protein
MERFLNSLAANQRIMKRWVSVLGVVVMAVQLHAQCLTGDCKYGYGKKKYKSGAVYSGQFLDGQIQGDGKIQYSDGSIYVGQWEKNARDGKGKMTFKNGDLYKGQFKKNTLQGTGLMEYSNGDRYDGAFKGGKKDGSGTYAYHNGDYFKGYFREDLRHGQGTMTYKGGSNYVGNWKNDNKNGVGTYTDENGFVYEGNWIDGEFDDPNASEEEVASNTASTSTTDSGFESKNLPDCNTGYCDDTEGIYIYADGSRYIGTHKKGKPEGQGTIYYINGDKYTGGWEKHAPHGKGFMTYHDGRTIAAEWSYGSPTRVLDSDEGIVDEHIEVDKSSEVKVWAVIIGVGRYQHMQTLKYTDDDAYRMYAFLKSPEGGAIPDQQIAVLIDEDATRSKMLRTMKQIFLKADDNDVVMLYFSGHGLEGSFVPSDFNGFNNLVKHTEITEIFKQSKAKHRIVFADACHSGSMLAMRSTSKVQDTVDKYYGAFNNIKGGTALLLSSKSEETSLEDSGLRQGVFSHFLMKGLKGKADTNNNKIVTIKELYNFVHKEVTDYTMNAQTPNLSGNYDKNMPVAIIRYTED